MEEEKTKPGIKTTEFWVSISTAISGLLLTLGWIGPDAQTQFPEAVGKVAGGLITIVSIVSYTWSRTKVKEPSKSNEKK